MDQTKLESPGELRRIIRANKATWSEEILLWGAYAIRACIFFATIVWRRLRCLAGFHAPGVPSGKIEIYRIDRDRHAIEYGNVLMCPRCGKRTGIDNAH
jgi:hypothetical protein